MRWSTCFIGEVALMICAQSAGAQTIYYAQSSNVYRLTANGSPIEPTVYGSSPQAFGVTKDHSILYMVETNDLRIVTVELDDPKLPRTGNCFDTFLKLTHNQPAVEAGDFVLDDESRMLYWPQGTFGSDDSWSIRRTDFVSSETVDTLLEDLDNIGALALDFQTSKIYWSEQPGTSPPALIRRANMDGSDVEPVLVGLNNLPVALDIDPVDRKLYWCEGGSGTHIYRISLDKTGPIEIPVFNANAVGLTVDSTNRKLYWADNMNIRRSALNGTNVEPVFSQSQGSTPIKWMRVVIDSRLPLSASCQQPIDSDFDRDIDLKDVAEMLNCATGP